MIKLFYGTLPGTVFLNFNAIYAQNRTVPSTGKVIEETRGDPIEFSTVLLGNSSGQISIAEKTSLEDGHFVLETNTLVDIWHCNSEGNYSEYG